MIKTSTLLWILLLTLATATRTLNNPCNNIIEFTLVPDSTDCEWYFQCINELAFHAQCAAGLTFDILTNNCNRPEVSVCILNLPTPPTPPVSDLPSTTSGTTPKTSTTIRTSLPQTTTTTRDATSEETTNEDISTTDDVESTESTTTDPTPFCPDDQLFYAPHPDCNRYFRCIYGYLYELECPPEQYWNQEKEQCDLMENVPCETEYEKM
ncbi:probable endochitinase [Wyeomyia smithii]|uniref:probable endochitinase n=1 Tax=Wyeomyia smithii TaxID=174621 RepID=UPI002467EB57|nr:probable endochitinase [Wyeomyia smithii]